MTKILFFDLETTGLDDVINGIHQLGGCIEIDGVVVEEFDFKIKPAKHLFIEDEALKVSGITRETIETYESESLVYQKFITMLSKHINKFDKQDKAFLSGWNNIHFDNRFLREFFIRQGDKFFGSWFWSNSIDVMVLASEYLKHERPDMPNFKLVTVARELLPEIDESKAHDANYDIEMTRGIYKFITNKLYGSWKQQ